MRKSRLPVLLFFACLLLLLPASSQAREVNFQGGEIKVYVVPGEPTVVSFPKDVTGGYAAKSLALDLEYRGRDLIIFPKSNLSHDGEVLIVYVTDERSFMLRVLPASSESRAETKQ